MKPVALFPANLSPRHTVEQAWDLREEGLSHAQIARELGVPRGTVDTWLSGRDGDTQAYDPYLDEVAITRALEGDREVFERLTMFERVEFLDRITDIRKAELRDAEGRFGRRRIVDRPEGESSLKWLSECLGLPAERLLRAVEGRLRDSRGKAA